VAQKTSFFMKNKLFYGWWMLLGMTIMYSATNGLAMYAFGVLRKMQATQSPNFGLDTQTQAALPAILFLAVALVSPFIGWVLDRYNTKSIITVGAILAVILTFSHQFMTSYNGLILIYVFFALAMSCAGIISFMYLINKWFRKNIGLAAGILVVGSSLGGIIFPRIAASAGDWHVSCNWLGIAAIICLIPPLFFIKNNPSEIGETPDGLPIENNAQKRHNTDGTSRDSREGGLTLATALRTPSFYLVLVVTGVLWFCINGYIQSHNFFMADIGKTSLEAVSIQVTFSMMAIGGKLLFGWLSDKLSRQYIMAGSILLMLISIFLVKQSMNNPSFISPFAMIFGLGFGGAFAIIQVWVADIYAGKNFGSILGVVTMVDTIAGSAGMKTIGSMRKASGSYDSGFNLLIGLCIIALVCTFLVKKPSAK
jgi:MFS transporter, OFA family, oxalate/formate antiporter